MANIDGDYQLVTCQACQHTVRRRHPDRPLRCTCGATIATNGTMISEAQYDTTSAGVGTELRKMLGCTCRLPISRLDEWGPEKCLAEFDAIVVELVVRSARHKEPIRKDAAKRMLRIAIERAGASPVDGRKLGIG